MTRWLAAIPVYNEVGTVQSVLDEVVKYAPDVLAVDDGSSDGTADLLDGRSDVSVIRIRHRRRVRDLSHVGLRWTASAQADSAICSSLPKRGYRFWITLFENLFWG